MKFCLTNGNGKMEKKEQIFEAKVRKEYKAKDYGEKGGNDGP